MTQRLALKAPVRLVATHQSPSPPIVTHFVCDNPISCKNRQSDAWSHHTLRFHIKCYRKHDVIDNYVGNWTTPRTKHEEIGGFSHVQRSAHWWLWGRGALYPAFAPRINQNHGKQNPTVALPRLSIPFGTKCMKQKVGYRISRKRLCLY